ncbi:MAG: hypothetical protein ACM3XM_05940 [Mycobacterium leprae]
MTEADDVRAVIAEQAASPGERKALTTVADALERSLAAEVPYRPEFKAELRRQLVAKARQASAPWYRRPAVWGSSVAAVAAAALVVTVGMRIFVDRAVPGSPITPTSVAENNPKSATGTGDQASHLVNRLKLPVLALPDEPALPGERPAPNAGLNLAAVKVFVLSGRPNEAQFDRIAKGLSFAGDVAREGAGYRMADTGRSLSMSADGLVVYAGPAEVSVTGGNLVMDQNAVRSIAQRFLYEAALPVPTLEPAVLEEGNGTASHGYRVVYTPQVGGRPVVNARTRVTLTDRGAVVAVEGYVQAAEQEEGSYEVIPPEQAVTNANKLGGGTFTQADLVYARTPTEQAVYLQPYWRVFGTNARGEALVRYVAALVAP